MNKDPDQIDAEVAAARAVVADRAQVWRDMQDDVRRTLAPMLLQSARGDHDAIVAYIARLHFDMFEFAAEDVDFVDELQGFLASLPAPAKPLPPKVARYMQQEQDRRELHAMIDAWLDGDHSMGKTQEALAEALADRFPWSYSSLLRMIQARAHHRRQKAR